MPKGTMLDRLAGAMKTLGKREGKALTPRQRVAAAQRWNSLADIGEDTADRMWDVDRDEFYKVTDELERLGLDQLPKAPPAVAARYKDAPLADSYDLNRGANPFLSDNLDKYAEQSDFLDWCRYNRLEPNDRNLKRFRWETYKELPYRDRQWIANKQDVLAEHPEIRTRRQLDNMAQDEWEMSEYPTDFWREPYTSIREFPDDFDYMWRY